MNCRNCQQPKEKHQHSLCSNNSVAMVEDYLEDRDDGNDLNFYHPEFPCYLNVYRVEQAYGGREEGSWWFDTGEPLESVLVDDAAQELEVKARLQRRYELDDFNNYAVSREEGGDIERIRGRSSAAGGYDIEIRKQYEYAQPYPTERPRYE